MLYVNNGTYAHSFSSFCSFLLFLLGWLLPLGCHLLVGLILLCARFGTCSSLFTLSAESCPCVCHNFHFRPWEGAPLLLSQAVHIAVLLFFLLYHVYAALLFNFNLANAVSRPPRSNKTTRLTKLRD